MGTKLVDTILADTMLVSIELVGTVLVGTVLVGIVLVVLSESNYQRCPKFLIIYCISCVVFTEEVCFSVNFLVEASETGDGTDVGR